MRNIEFITAWGRSGPQTSYVPFHSHKFYELVYYQKGQGVTHIGDESYEFYSGSCVLIPPDMPHDEKHALDYKLFCVRFQMEEKLDRNLYRDSDGQLGQIAESIVEESISQNFGTARC